MPATAEVPQPILDIYYVALAIRNETCDRVSQDAGDFLFFHPERQWRELIESRRNSEACDVLTTAAKNLVRVADDELRPFVKRAARRLLDSVRALASYQPGYIERVHVVEASEARALRLSNHAVSYNYWTLDTASLARLDELRSEVYVKLVELEALFKDYPDALSRVIAVARRIAGHVLKPVDAERVAEWLKAVA